MNHKPLEPTPYLEQIMREADTDLAAGNVTECETVDEALAHLDSLKIT